MIAACFYIIYYAGDKINRYKRQKYNQQGVIPKGSVKLQMQDTAQSARSPAARTIKPCKKVHHAGYARTALRAYKKQRRAQKKRDAYCQNNNNSFFHLVVKSSAVSAKGRNPQEHHD